MRRRASQSNKPAGSRLGQPHQCRFCGKRLPSPAGVKRHIRQSAQCSRAWDAWIITADAAANPVNLHSDDEGPAIKSNELEDPNNTDFVVNAPESGDENPNPYRARVEEVPDEDDLVYWVQTYPGPAGEVIGTGECTFERWARENEEEGRSCWYPFTNEKEWELGRWLAKNVGQNQIEEFLKLAAVGYTYLFKSDMN